MKKLNDHFVRNQIGIDMVLILGCVKNTLDLELGFPSGGIDDGNGFPRRGLVPAAMCIVLEDITIYDLSKGISGSHLEQVILYHLRCELWLAYVYIYIDYIDIDDVVGNFLLE